MSGYIVPMDYNEQPGVVPIFIAERDEKGNMVLSDWITKAVVPCADRLRAMAKHILHDERYVSEITETAVHSLSRNYPEVGEGAPRQLMAAARHSALDLAAGGNRGRRGMDVSLTWKSARLSEDPLPGMETWDIERFVRRELKDDPLLIGMMNLILQGYSQREAAKLVVGESADTLWRRWQRFQVRLKTRAGHGLDRQ